MMFVMRIKHACRWLLILSAILLCFQITDRSRAPLGLISFFTSPSRRRGRLLKYIFYAPNRERASELFEEAFGEIERVETAFSNYRSSSELSRINASAADGPVITDPEVFALLARALSYSQRTDGAFDITVGKLMKAWGFFTRAGYYP